MTLMIGSSKITPSIFPKNNIKNQDKTITENGVYTADEGYTGLGEVTVDVSGGDKYKVGDRVNDDSDNPVGTVSSIFTDGNGDRYAVVCLDAVNRLDSGYYLYNAVNVSGIPQYQNQSVWSATETATTNTTAILATDTSIACSHCRSKSFTIGGVTYEGQFPNLNELAQIFMMRTLINSQDPTASTYSSLIIPTSKNTWSSTQSSSQYAWYISSNGRTWNGDYKTFAFFVIPVLEIPLD